MIALLLNLVLAILWCALLGDTSSEQFVLGFMVGYAILWFLGPLVGGSYHRKLPAAIGLAFFFLKELVLSTVEVATEVVTPTTLRRPGIVAVPLDATTDAEITLLANLVTLTPGTMAIDVSLDRHTLYVHAMFVDDPERVRRGIKDGFEQRILRLLREQP
jgi:multicomponent Na+:H+ antiporter subunit E